MQVRVRVLPGGPDEVLQLDAGSDALQLLDHLTLSPDAHIVLREGRPVPVDTPLRDGDELDVVTVISGGASGAEAFNRGLS